MGSIIVVAALAVLALITQAGVVVLQRTYPAQGQTIEVAGATLNVLGIGPSDGATIGPAANAPLSAHSRTRGSMARCIRSANRFPTITITDPVMTVAVTRS